MSRDSHAWPERSCFLIGVTPVKLSCPVNEQPKHLDNGLQQHKTNKHSQGTKYTNFTPGFTYPSLMAPTAPANPPGRHLSPIVWGLSPPCTDGETEAASAGTATTAVLPPLLNQLLLCFLLCLYASYIARSYLQDVKYRCVFF